MTINKPLTATQKEVLMHIKNSISESSQSPTLLELKNKLNVCSINTVVSHLTALENKGYIIRRKHLKRNIEIRDNLSKTPDTTWTISIPVVASVGCDDLSTYVNEKYDESIEIDSKLIGDKKDVFAVRAVGNSMNDSGIENGDYVIVEPTNIANNGEKVVAVIGDMITIKRLERREDLVILRPESSDPKYKPIILSQNFKISGKVICTIPKDTRDVTEVIYDKGY